jgi:hypothetical protein
MGSACSSIPSEEIIRLLQHNKENDNSNFLCVYPQNFRSCPCHIKSYQGYTLNQNSNFLGQEIRFIAERQQIKNGIKDIHLKISLINEENK